MGRKRKHFGRKVKTNRFITSRDAQLYSMWRKSVCTRDSYRCQMPGCTYWGRGVQVHHIQKWADNPPLRYAPSNGITLCIACHKKVNGKEEHYSQLFRTIILSKYKEM